MKVELTEQEIIFIQACYNDSQSEGHFDTLFDTIDQEAVETSLTEKGILKSGE